jgi:hypothetical protein
VGLDTEYDDYPTQRAGERSAQVIQIDSGKHLAVVAVCAALCGMAGALSAWSAYTAIRAEREARMLAYYINEVDGKLIHAGFIEPRERWSPEKRKQYQENQP